MSDTDYTPTTDEVRASLAFHESECNCNRSDYQAVAGCFDRWLAAHDKEVLEKAAQVIETNCLNAMHYDASKVAWDDDWQICDNCAYLVAAIRGEGEQA